LLCRAYAVPTGKVGGMPRITKRLVDGLKAAGREFFVRDDKLIGFALRVQPSGVMSYVVEYRAGSGTCRFSAGRKSGSDHRPGLNNRCSRQSSRS
jgi:hypothetical protein